MRIGVYVDGFNLYYGARGLCGRGTPGWRWLDLRGLAADLVGRRGRAAESGHGKPGSSRRVIVDPYTTRLLVGRVSCFCQLRAEGIPQIDDVVLGR